MKDSCVRLNVKRNSGHTLVGTMISITALMILITGAIPAFDGLLKRNQQRQSTQTLLSLINFTRLQAAETRVQAVMCPSLDKAECENDWNLPIMVFNDANGDRIRNSEEPLLKYVNVVQHGETLSWGTFRDSNYLHFDADGTTEYQNGTFYYCNGVDDNYRSQIAVSKPGRARIVARSQLSDRC